MFVVCDISGMGGNEPYWVVGSLWLPLKRVADYEKDIVSFRIEKKIWGELKWNNISHQMLPAFQQFLDITVKNYSAEFRGIVIKKEKVDLKKFHNGDETLALA